jgi:hypothetical protein
MIEALESWAPPLFAPTGWGRGRREGDELLFGDNKGFLLGHLHGVQKWSISCEDGIGRLKLQLCGYNTHSQMLSKPVNRNEDTIKGRFPRYHRWKTGQMYEEYGGGVMLTEQVYTVSNCLFTM